MEGEIVDDYVNVAIRIRPVQNTLGGSVELISKNPPVLLVADRQHSYTFDNIFSKDATQEQIYEQMVKPLVQRVLLGYNCTVFAYGQTGTGKTYTMGSDPCTYKDTGFILRTLYEVFDNREQCREVDISISFFEIYNEKVYDLLENSKVALLVKGFKIEGLAQRKVSDAVDAYNLLKAGTRNRHVSETKQNSNSSRSHAIFTIHCNVKSENSETSAKLNLVDLAGSESVRRTGNEGALFLESISINKGLFCIGRVIHALSSKMKFVPYRQSLITTVLRDSLDRNNYITLIACISPDSEDVYETIQTLEIAQGAKKLNNKPEVNTVLQQYKKNNPGFFEQPALGSAVKMRATPLKRHLANCVSTVKKRKLVNVTPATSTRINQATSPLLISMSVSSSRSALSEIRPALPLVSPIVRKYTKAIENSMMEELQDSLKTHLCSSTPHEANMLQFFWQKFNMEVTHMVRSEVIHLTHQRACSSMIGEEDFGSIADISCVQDTKTSFPNIVAKKLEFDQESACSEPTDETIFKVPTALFQKASRKPKTSRQNKDVGLDVSNIGNEDATNVPSTSFSKPPRRSTRLSLKNAAATVTDSPVKRRQSVRLSAKKKAKGSPQRLQEATPVPKKVGKKATQIEANADEDPMLNHAEHILNILNTGNQKDLQQLASIGAKTAAHIIFYRRLKGQFSNISDLAKMESWRGTAYQRFLKANYLKVEDDD